MAHVMKPPIGRMPAGPYPDNQYIPTTTHGWVHANTWFANAPFNSAPPPAPAGINPQTWANGHWQPNPFFRPPQNMTQPPNTGFQMWAPHPGWGNNAAASGQQSWNPYKRVPKPGDASYWATELSDNPLKLENMHIRDDTPAEERHRKDSSNGVPHTPWVWVPKELSNDTSKSAESNGTSGPRDGQNGQRQYEQSQKDLPPAPQAHRREHTYDHTRTHSGPNAYASPTSHDSAQSRHYPPRSASVAQDRAPSSAPATVSTYSAYHQQQQQQQQQRQQQEQQQRQQQQYQQQSQPSDRYPASSQQHTDAGQHHQRQQSRNVSPRESYDSQPYGSRDYRSGPTSSASSSAAAAAAASRHASTDSSASNEREPGRSEGFNARRELQPTFSPKIVRTPDHYYSSSSGRLGSHDDLERTPRHSASTPTHGPIYAPTRSNSLSAGRHASTPTPSSSASTNGNSSLGLMNLNQSLTDEPESVLSPLIVPGTPPDTSSSASSTRPSPNGRNEIGRSQTYPSVAFDREHEERDHQRYRKTPREYPRAISREPSDRERDRERDRDRDRERRRDYSRSRDTDATPQPGARTPPAHTPPLSHYTRPSPEHRAAATPISRSHTYPAVIPPPPITPQRSRSPGRSPRYSPSASQPPSSYNSPYGASAYSSSRTSPNPQPSSIANAASPLRHNPLPRPPQVSPYAEQYAARGSAGAYQEQSARSSTAAAYTEQPARSSSSAYPEQSTRSASSTYTEQPTRTSSSAYPEQATRGSSSASAAAAAVAQQHQQQQQQQQRGLVRQGYWNRRGDHLHVNEKGERWIVYAPRAYANPVDLTHYPSPTEGWRDHHGNFIRYDPNVPELFDSLPMHGEEPLRPYHKFVQYA